MTGKEFVEWLKDSSWDRDPLIKTIKALPGYEKATVTGGACGEPYKITTTRTEVVTDTFKVNLSTNTVTKLT